MAMADNKDLDKEFDENDFGDNEDIKSLNNKEINDNGDSHSCNFKADCLS